MKSIRKPDAIVIGMPRSGTTWLFRVLSQHPDIFIPKNKEINFFNKKFYYLSNKRLKNPNRAGGINHYYSYFKSAPKDKTAVDMSILSALDDSSSTEIKKYFPGVKIIACLRNPSDHAYSMYQLMYSEGEVKNKTFDEYVRKRPDLLKHSFYYNHLKPYFKNFPRRNIHIIYLDDIKKDPKKALRKLVSFLGVKRIELDIGVDKHASWQLRYPIIRRFFKRSAMLVNRLGLTGLWRRHLKYGPLGKAIYRINQLNVKSRDVSKKIDKKTSNSLERLYGEQINLLEKKLKLRVPANWKK